MFYYKFNISDYNAHTGHLEPLEDLAYRRMLDWLYLHEKPLPKSVDEIARFIRMRPHCECIANVLHEFFVEDEEGYFNERCNKELQEYSDKCKTNKKAADARWKKEKAKKRNKINKLDDDANALQVDSERNAKQETLNIKQEPITINNNKENKPSNDDELKFLESITNHWNEIMTTQPKINLLEKTVINKKRVSAIKKIVKDYPDYSDHEYFEGYFYRLATLEDFRWQRENKQVKFDQATNLEKFTRNIELMRMGK